MSLLVLRNKLVVDAPEFVITKLDFENTLEEEKERFILGTVPCLVSTDPCLLPCASARKRTTGDTSDARPKPHCWTGKLSLVVG